MTTTMKAKRDGEFLIPEPQSTSASRLHNGMSVCLDTLADVLEMMEPFSCWRVRDYAE